MRFLADESCDFAIVRALRAAGHDVIAVVEISPRAEDPEVVDLACDQGRLLLTERARIRARPRKGLSDTDVL